VTQVTEGGQRAASFALEQVFVLQCGASVVRCGGLSQREAVFCVRRHRRRSRDSELPASTTPAQAVKRRYNSAPAHGLRATTVGAFTGACSARAGQQDQAVASLKNAGKHALSFDSITAGGRGPIHQTMEVDRTR